MTLTSRFDGRLARARSADSAQHRSVLLFWLLLLGALLPGYKTGALPGNLATNGSATGSSEGYGSVFGDANDGNRDGHFYNSGSVWHTVIPDANAFYEIDLGGTFFLDRVMIWPRTDVIQGTVRNFRLSVFDSSGQPVWQHDYLPTNDAANVWAATQMRNVQGRRVRFARLDQVGNNWLTFAEFEVWGQNTPIATNVALGKPVSGTPAAALGTAVTAGNDGVIDGDFNHAGHPIYRTITAATGQYWQVDLGVEQALDYIIIFNRTDFTDTSNVNVSVRDAGELTVYATNINIARDVAVRGGAQHDVTIRLPGLVNGRYVRLETTSPEYLSFAEVEVFGPPPPSPPGLVSIQPAAGEVLAALTQVQVIFSEPVLGVDAADLLVNGSPADNVTAVSPVEYRFGFASPPNGAVTLNWSATCGITDLDGAAFAGGNWSYQLDSSLPPPRPVISEFIADNQGGLRDEDLDSPDWIELFNPGPLQVNLAGWFLTDTASNLTRWRFPATNLAANAYLVVFASGKNRATPGAPLHVNFKLDANAGYLALVRPDGTGVASEFTYGQQRRNVSFGNGRALLSTPLLAAGAMARVLVPTHGLPGPAWTGGSEPFDDSTWSSGLTGVGFDQSTNGGSGGPIGFWQFNEASDPNHAPDSSGHSHTGTVVPPAGFSSDAGGRTGQPGDRAMDFGPTGNGAYVNIPDAASGMFDSATAHDAITVSLWIDGDTSQPGNGSVFWASGNADGTGSRSAQAHLPWSDSVIYWDTGCCDSGSRRVSVGEPNPAKWRGEWNHYAFVKNGDTKEIWQNGTRILQGVNTDNLASIRGFAIGAMPGGQLSYGGRIDDFAVWDVALTAEQIQALASGASPLDARRFSPLVGTDISAAMLGVNASALLRAPFVVADPAPYDVLVLRMRYDDGFVAYLNGVEVARRNAPADLNFDSAATAERPPGASLEAEEIDLSSFASLLREGTNVLAIHALNRTADDRELLVLPELIAGRSLTNRFFPTPTPGAANDAGVRGFVEETQASPGRGFFFAPFDVTIQAPTPGATLVYTTDGSEPTLSHGMVASGTNVTLQITDTTVLRDAAFKEDHQPSPVETHSFIFPGNVGMQRRPPTLGATWPDGAPTDFEMDPRVLTNALPGYGVTDALSSIPTLSIVTPYEGLFGANGIYPNSGGQGDQWERAASVELIYPDGRAGFQENAGLQIHGNISRDKSFTPKHGFSVLFRSRYGASMLEFPMFADTTIRRFNRLVLRAGSTDTWPVTEWTTFLVDGVLRWYRTQASYVRDQWVRDAQIAMGQPSSHGNYAHLFLNGWYWGLYNVCERPDDDFAAAHLGGDAEEYDVLADFAEVHSGNADAWNQMMTLASQGLGTVAAYQRIQGNNPDGTRNPDYPVFLDVTNLVDYMILHVFIGADDWPNHNWWAARRRGPDSAGFKFFAWDQEISINSLVKQHSSWGPLYAEADVPGTPTYVYARCRANAEFRRFFGDRVQRHLFNDGALSLSKNLERWNARAVEIDRAIVAESARWGDYQRPSKPYKREVEYLANDTWMRTVFFPSNHFLALKRFRDAGLFPALNAPVFQQHGGFIPAEYSLSITNPNGTGSILYTVDGSDPRLAGGSAAPSARLYSAPVPLTGHTLVRARVQNGTSWSALVEADFHAPQDFGPLQLSEIDYDPPDLAGVDGASFEFIELRNTGPETLDLSGFAFTGGVAFTFTNGARIGPGEFWVLAKDAGSFATVFPNAPVNGIFSGKLDNSGETITLTHPLGFTVWSVTYDDSPPWPGASASSGRSLQRINNRPDANDPANWSALPPTPGAPPLQEVTDTDADGLPDSWEQANGTNPDLADGDDDPDHDGMTNLEEFRAGTNPLDPASVLRITDVALDRAASAVVLVFQTVSNRTYSVQWRTNASTGAWQLLENIPATPFNRTTQATHALAPAESRFYRLVTPAIP